MKRAGLPPAIFLAALAWCGAASAGSDPAKPAPPNRPKPIGAFTLHDFAAKWMMQQDDIAGIDVYRRANAALLGSGDARPRIVMMGDSITYHWTPEYRPGLASLNIVDRGIKGQNSSQMLLRFEADVVALKPAAVLILAGTNDLRVYAGKPAAASPAILARLFRNITAMADIATANGIKVVLCSIPPVGSVGHRFARDPDAILQANAWLHDFAKSRDYPFVDYYSVLADGQAQMPQSLTKDGMHPNEAGYGRMWPKLRAALARLGLPGVL